MKNDPKAQVRQFILKQFPLVRKRQLQDSDALLESGLVDSLGVLQVVTFLEQTFSIKVSDEDLVPDNFQTIDTITALISERTNLSGDSHGDMCASH
jgi:acyl carrier protein